MAVASMPSVSMIIPCRNEEKYIAACIECVLATEYPKERFQVIVADGRSSDGTLAILHAYAAKDSRINVVDNPQQSTPSGLNAALSRSTGEVIMLMGAHSRFPPDYVSGLVLALQESNADATGGVCRTQPADDSALSRAIALGMSHPFGVGNSHFRIGASKPRWVDTVAFGCYRREVFERIGVFDTELPRNQDDEFNLRLLRAGGRMLLVPTVQSEYFARSTLRMLGRMYYQYGLYKPLVARKVGGFLTIRQIVPAAFVLSLAGLLILAPWIALGRWLAVTEISAYLLLASIVIVTHTQGNGLGVRLRLLPVFLTLHMGYGTGFIVGCLRFYLRGSRHLAKPQDLPLSR